jgi:hypothetical protein
MADEDYNYTELLVFSISLLLLSVLSIFLNYRQRKLRENGGNGPIPSFLKLLFGITTLAGSLLLTIQFAALNSAGQIICTVINQLGNFLLLLGAGSCNMLALYRLNFMWDRSFKGSLRDERSLWNISNISNGVAIFRLLSQLAVFIEDPSISSTATLSTGVEESVCRWGLGTALIYLFALDLAITLFVTFSMSIILWNSLLDTVEEIEAENKHRRTFRDSIDKAKIKGGKLRKRDSIYAVMSTPGNGSLPSAIKTFLLKTSVLVGINILAIVSLSFPSFGYHAITIVLLHGIFNLFLVVIDWTFLFSYFASHRRESDESSAENGRQSTTISPNNTLCDVVFEDLIDEVDENEEEEEVVFEDKNHGSLFSYVKN